MGITIYTRLRQIETIVERRDNVKRAIGKINERAFWVGIGSCVGISIVANFQETNVRIVHFVGAFACFGLGTVYFWMQVKLCF